MDPKIEVTDLHRRIVECEGRTDHPILKFLFEDGDASKPKQSVQILYKRWVAASLPTDHPQPICNHHSAASRF
jgi:hypothetical protein